MRRVTFALVPNDTLERKAAEGGNHPVVKIRWFDPEHRVVQIIRRERGLRNPALASCAAKRTVHQSDRNIGERRIL